MYPPLFRAFCGSAVAPDVVRCSYTAWCLRHTRGHAVCNRGRRQAGGCQAVQLRNRSRQTPGSAADAVKLRGFSTKYTRKTCQCRADDRQTERAACTRRRLQSLQQLRRMRLRVRQPLWPCATCLRRARSCVRWTCQHGSPRRVGGWTEAKQLSACALDAPLLTHTPYLLSRRPFGHSGGAVQAARGPGCCGRSPGGAAARGGSAAQFAQATRAPVSPRGAARRFAAEVAASVERLYR
jgi:hypothetical protein